MTSGMATVAGTVMVLYASILREAIPGIVGHLLTASIISAPAAITVIGTARALRTSLARGPSRWFGQPQRDRARR